VTHSVVLDFERRISPFGNPVKGKSSNVAKTGRRGLGRAFFVNELSRFCSGNDDPCMCLDLVPNFASVLSKPLFVLSHPALRDRVEVEDSKLLSASRFACSGLLMLLLSAGMIHCLSSLSPSILRFCRLRPPCLSSVQGTYVRINVDLTSVPLGLSEQGAPAATL
jgi:hypothetical protein